MYAALTSIASVKAWSKNTGTADDATLTTLIARASEAIGRHCGRDNLGEVATYNEVYFPSQKSWFRQRIWNLMLRHYPIVSLTAVTTNNVTQPLLTASQLMSGSSGVWVESEPEPRMLKFIGITLVDPSILQISYTAGYATVPLALQQACDQYVVEILRSEKFVNLKTVGMAGETTSYDMGGSWGMSNRVRTMCDPYRDVAGHWAQ